MVRSEPRGCATLGPAPNLGAALASGCFFFFFRRALFFQRLTRFFLVFLLSVHAFAHDYHSLSVDQQKLHSILRATNFEHFPLCMPACRIAGRFRRFFADPAYTEFSTRYSHLLQFLEYLLRHAFGQIDETVVFPYVNSADVDAFDFRLVRYRADDIARLDSMY